MTKEQLLEYLQEEWYRYNDDVTREYYTDAIIIFVDENCDEIMTTDNNGNEIQSVNWVLDHFDWSKPKNKEPAYLAKIYKLWQDFFEGEFQKS